MNQKLKVILIISAKQAVGVLVGNSALWALMPKTFNFHDLTGITNFGLAALSLIVAAEGKVWIPKLLAWSQSPTPGGN